MLGGIKIENNMKYTNFLRIDVNVSNRKYNDLYPEEEEYEELVDFLSKIDYLLVNDKETFNLMPEPRI